MIDGKREGERKIWTRDEVVMQKGFRRSMKRKAKKKKNCGCRTMICSWNFGLVMFKKNKSQENVALFVINFSVKVGKRNGGRKKGVASSLCFVFVFLGELIPSWCMCVFFFFAVL